MAVTKAAWGPTNRYPELVEQFNDQMGAWQSQAEMVCNIEMAPNAASRRINADLPIADIGTWDGSANLTELQHGSTHVTTVTPQAYGGRLIFTEIEEAREPGLIANAASRLTTAVQRTMESVVFTRLEAGDDDTVDNGAGGSITVFNTAHPYGVPGGGGTDTNDNKLAGALSHTTLDAARVALRNWRNSASQPMELDRGPLALVVPPALGDTARRLVYSDQFAQSVSGSVGATGAEINPWANRSVVVVETAQLSSAAEWYLIARDHTPLNLWVPTPPSIRILQDPANRQYSVSVVFEAKAYWKAPIQGIIANNITVE